MTKKLELYRCNVCKNLIQVLLEGIGELVCCNKPMEHLIPHTEEGNELAEKHIPVIETRDNGRFVMLYHHPMIPEHFIEFMEVYPKDKSALRLKYFNPDDTAEFDITGFEEDIEAVEYCNIHGLWKSAEEN